MDPRIVEVLRFWFDQAGPQKWFAKDTAFDDVIRDRFAAIHADAASGGLASWRKSPQGKLALIVLFDQFSRNMYRNDAKAFATDSLALAVAKDLRTSGDASKLTAAQQAIALMPFEHAEDKDAQKEAVAGMTEIAEAATDPEQKKMFENMVDYAKRHQDAIAKFGRFPGRNEALGRASTPDEKKFLAVPENNF